MNFHKCPLLSALIICLWQKLAREFKELIEQVFFLAGVSLIGDVIPYLGFLDRIMNHKAAMQKVHHSFDSFLAGVLEEHRQHQRQSTGSKAERDFVDILLALPGEDGAPHLDEPLIKALLMVGYVPSFLCIATASLSRSISRIDATSARTLQP